MIARLFCIMRGDCGRNKRLTWDSAKGGAILNYCNNCGKALDTYYPATYADGVRIVYAINRVCYPEDAAWNIARSFPAPTPDKAQLKHSDSGGLSGGEGTGV